MRAACDAEDYDSDTCGDDDDYQKQFDISRTTDLVMISRLAVVLYEHGDGHPITHITGVPVGQIVKLAKSYAPGVNVGVYMPHKDFPHNNLTQTTLR